MIATIVPLLLAPVFFILGISAALAFFEWLAR